MYAHEIKKTLKITGMSYTFILIIFLCILCCSPDTESSDAKKSSGDEVHVSDELQLRETDVCYIYYKQIDGDKIDFISYTIQNGFNYIKTNFYNTEITKFKVYVYHTQADLVQGLIKYSGFTEADALRFQNSGAPRPMNGIFHLPVSFGMKTTVHELTHIFIEALSGDAYKKIKWLDEGIAEYIGYQYWKLQVASNYIDDQKSYLSNFYNNNKSVFYALSDISLASQWSALNNGTASGVIYNESFYTVSMLNNQQGMNKLKSVLIEVKNGKDAETAVNMIINKTQSEVYNELTGLTPENLGLLL